MESLNPSNGKLIKKYETHNHETVEQALTAARSQFTSWSQTSFSQRASVLNKLADLLEKSKEDLANRMASEMGKLVKEGISEVEKCVWVCHYYAGNGEAFLKPELIDSSFAKSYVSFQPLGVILGIMPWNFPFWQVFRFAAPTLMAGNVVVVKHAKNVNACAEALEDLFKQASLENQIYFNLRLNIEETRELIGRPEIAGVSLTGSTKAGKDVASIAGAHMKKCLLELGGNDPYLILKDANLESALRACEQSRLLNAGQSCIAAKRFIVHKDLLNEFTQKLKDSFEKIKMGDPTQEDTQLGPMAREDLRDGLHQQVLDSLEKGAKLIVGGEIPDRKGFYYPATILTNVEPNMPAFDEELFGPVAAIISADTDEKAIKLANLSNYGLGAAVFSKNIKRAEEIAREQIESGACFVNDFVKSDPRLPFGGTKDSGLGRELSHYGIKEFTNIKTICISE